MSTIPIGRARRLAKEKIGSALVTYLNDYIADAAADSSYTVPPPMPGIAGPDAPPLPIWINIVLLSGSQEMTPVPPW